MGKSQLLGFCGYFRKPSVVFVKKYPGIKTNVFVFNGQITLVGFSAPV